MADTKEILMRIGGGGDADLDAECSAMLLTEPSDPLMRDFTRGKFFAIQDFSFSGGLQDEEAKLAEKANQDLKAKAGNDPKATILAPGKPAKRSFDHWRAGNEGLPYPLEVEPISFSRMMDKATPKLFENFIGSTTLKSATIVRRMVMGTDQAPRAYLRLAFSWVLITSLDWEEDEQIKEKYKFICQKVEIQYKPQGDDGRLAPPIPGLWPNPK